MNDRRDRPVRSACGSDVTAFARCAGLWLVLALSAAVSAQAPRVELPPLTIDAVQVTPAAPAPRSLCRLRVTITNRGDRPASRLRLMVRVNGRALEAYDHTIYLQTLPPHESTDLALYNFWTSETFRPEPPDRKLQIQVVLLAAEWMATGPASDGVPTSTPIGHVGELPSTKRVVIPLKAQTR